MVSYLFHPPPLIFAPSRADPTNPNLNKISLMLQRGHSAPEPAYRAISHGKSLLALGSIVLHLPVSSDMLKNEAKGFPSDTRPYRMFRGLPRSPSSAWTRRTTSPGFRVGFRRVVGGAKVNTGGVSCSSCTATRSGQLAMFLVSLPISVHGSYKELS